MKKLIHNIQNDELTLAQTVTLAFALMAVIFGIIYLLNPTVTNL